MLFYVSCQTPSIISPCQLVSWLYINFEVLLTAMLQQCPASPARGIDCPAGSVLPGLTLWAEYDYSVLLWV